MSKVKMKCAHCGKHFKSSQAKQTLCPDCEARERRARAATKATPAKPAAQVSSVRPPKIVGPGAGILVPGMAPEASTVIAPEVRAPAVPSAPHPGAHAPRHPGHPVESEKPAKADRHEHPAKHTKASKAPAPPREPRKPREPKPQTPPFELTDELRARVEARYMELAQPVEFDGIRTQIAAELNIPKTAVKRAVKDLRTRMQLPSWWDLRAFTGSEEDLARIRATYVPLLPLPEVGIHKQIATDLGLDPGLVYQGIRRIRAEMHLPQYNPPELHETPADQSEVPVAAPAASTASATPGTPASGM